MIVAAMETAAAGRQDRPERILFGERMDEWKVWNLRKWEDSEAGDTLCIQETAAQIKVGSIPRFACRIPISQEKSKSRKNNRVPLIPARSTSMVVVFMVAVTTLRLPFQKPFSYSVTTTISFIF